MVKEKGWRDGDVVSSGIKMNVRCKNCKAVGDGLGHGGGEIFVMTKRG